MIFLLQTGDLLDRRSSTGLPARSWEPVAALNVAVFYLNRALQTSEVWYGYAAAAMAALVSGFGSRRPLARTRLVPHGARPVRPRLVAPPARFPHAGLRPGHPRRRRHRHLPALPGALSRRRRRRRIRLRAGDALERRRPFRRGRTRRTAPRRLLPHHAGPLRAGLASRPRRIPGHRLAGSGAAHAGSRTAWPARRIPPPVLDRRDSRGRPRRRLRSLQPACPDLRPASPTPSPCAPARKRTAACWMSPPGRRPSSSWPASPRCCPPGPSVPPGRWPRSGSPNSTAAACARRPSC